MIDPTEWFCASGTCVFADARAEPYYWDNGHLNANGRRFITPALEQALRVALAGAGPRSP